MQPLRYVVLISSTFIQMCANELFEYCVNQIIMLVVITDHRWLGVTMKTGACTA